MRRLLTALTAISLIAGFTFAQPARVSAVGEKVYWISDQATGATAGSGISCDEPDFQANNAAGQYFNDALAAIYADIDDGDHDDVIINLCDANGAMIVYEVDDWVNWDPTNPGDDALYSIHMRGINFMDQDVPADAGDVVIDGNDTWRSGIDLQDVDLTLSDFTIENTFDGDDGAAVSVLATEEVTPSLELDSMVIDSSETTGDGAVYVEGHVTISDSTFTDNEATSSGGAVYSAATLTITGSDFYDNRADEHGGAVYATGDVSIDDSLFDGNFAALEGGAVSSVGDYDVTISNSRFAENGILPDGPDLDEDIDDITEEGGAIYLYDIDNLVLTDVIFGDLANDMAGNDADWGSDIYSAIGGAVDRTQFNISGYQSNYTGADGMYLSCVAGTIADSHFEGASATAIEIVEDVACNDQESFVIQDTTFIDNGDRAVRVYDSGLGLLRVVRSDFTANFSSGDGGAIRSGAVENVVVTNSRFNNNEADDYGGAIHAEDCGALTISNSSFIENEADDDEGGAVSAYECPLTVSSSSFRGNRSDDDDGGAIYGYERDVTIRGSSFFSNSSDSDGGAVFVEYGSLTIENSRFEFNESDNHGGAVYFDGDDQDVLTITRSALHGNAANVDNGSTGAGGAISAWDVPSVNISGNVITGNLARFGGAIHLEIDSVPKQRDLVLVAGLRSNTFKGNGTFNSEATQINAGRVLSLEHEEFNGACTAMTSGRRIETQLSKSRNKLTGVRSGQAVAVYCSNDSGW